MERFRLKKYIYLVFIAIFLFIFNKVDIVNASSYSVDIEIIGLEYGDSYSECEIVVIEQTIPGTFQLIHPEYVINRAGTFDIGVAFYPEDTTYESMYMSVLVEISPIDVVIVFSSPIIKQYDGNNSVILPNYTYEGIVHPGVEVVGELQARYSATYVGDDIDIILEGISLEGADASAYNLVLTGHIGSIYPSYLQDPSSEVSLKIEKNVYIDIRYVLEIKKEKVSNVVNEKYTAIRQYGFVVYDNSNKALDVDGKYQVALKVEESFMNTERLHVFELDKDNKYRELSYKYSNGVMYFEMETDSKIVFTTRNIEYHFIVIFSAILLFSFAFIVVYRIKNSKIKIDNPEEEN